MVNTLAINMAITKKQLTKRFIAKELGISEQALYNKLKNIAEFKAGEVFKLKILLNLSEKECYDIFFAKK